MTEENYKDHILIEPQTASALTINIDDLKSLIDCHKKEIQWFPLLRSVILHRINE